MIGHASLLLAGLQILHVVVYSKQISGMMDNIAFSESESNNCSCIGDTLTFECTVIRGVGIIWRGTAFNCPSIGNEIYLLETSISVSTCNKGMVTGRIVRVRENNYTSQLNVTLGSDLIGQTVECAYDDGTGSQIIANRTLDILSPYPPPKKFSLALVMFGSKKITFSWSPVAPDCPAVHYNNILSSNCGSCPTTTATNKVTCDVRNHPESLCTFAVQRVVCGNITGNVSEYITLDITETMNELATSEEATTRVTSRCTAATASASIFAIGLTISIIVFTSIIIVLIKANKNRARSSRQEEEDVPDQQPLASLRTTAVPGSTPNVTIYDDDYDVEKVATIATNKNIAYENPAIQQTDSSANVEHEYAQIH